MKVPACCAVAIFLVAQLALSGCASSGGGGRKLEVSDDKSFDGLL